MKPPVGLVRLVDPASADEEQAAFFARTPPIAFFRLLAHSPQLAGRLAGLGAAVMSGMTLDPKLREIAAIRVGHRLNAPYVVGQHERVAARLGLAPDIVAAIRQDLPGPGLAAPEAFVIRYVDALVAGAPPPFDDPAYLKLSERGRVELATTVGYFSMLATVTRSFGLQPDAPI
jgi:alkylhydroperoxidase family enzyme